MEIQRLMVRISCISLEFCMVLGKCFLCRLADRAKCFASPDKNGRDNGSNGGSGARPSPPAEEHWGAVAGRRGERRQPAAGEHDRVPARQGYEIQTLLHEFLKLFLDRGKNTYLPSHTGHHLHSGPLIIWKIDQSLEGALFAFAGRAGGKTKFSSLSQRRSFDWCFSC